MLNFPDSLTHHEINLYKSLKRVIGRHFFFYCLGLSSLGKHEIIPSLCEMVNFFFKNIQLLACTCNTLEFHFFLVPRFQNAKMFWGFFRLPLSNGHETVNAHGTFLAKIFQSTLFSFKLLLSTASCDSFEYLSWTRLFLSFFHTLNKR